MPTTVDLNSPRGKIALEYASAGYARDVVRDLVRATPDITGQQVLDVLEAAFQEKLTVADDAVVLDDPLTNLEDLFAEGLISVEDYRRLKAKRDQ